MPGYFCSSVQELQYQLQKIGLYRGPIDNVSRGALIDAIASFAASRSIQIPDAVQVRGQDVYSFASPLSIEFCQALTQAAGPTFGPATSTDSTSTLAARRMAATRMSSVLASRSYALPILGREQTPVEDEPPPPPVITYVETPPELGWWASQTPTVRYAIIGGGLLAVAGATYYLTRPR